MIVASRKDLKKTSLQGVKTVESGQGRGPGRQGMDIEKAQHFQPGASCLYSSSGMA